jgi:acyl-CoA thioester hydrolase
MNKNNHRTYETRLTIPFHDLDPMQIVWHGNYLKYFDMARFGLFNEAGIDLYSIYEENQYIFPITKTSAKHILPLRYGDEIICKATLVEARIKIVLDFEIRMAENGTVCTRGRGEQLAVKIPEMETLFQIPDLVREALG